jgi:hypothetical protein
LPVTPISDLQIPDTIDLVAADETGGDQLIDGDGDPLEGLHGAAF